MWNVGGYDFPEVVDPQCSQISKGDSIVTILQILELGTLHHHTLHVVYVLRCVAVYVLSMIIVGCVVLWFYNLAICVIFHTV